ncbi:type IV secretory system conjugative DNA transfer family protein [Nostoc sp.]|uniref:type IV secretory system conjugative DNA transfer family protein n=1 Tax=Nostoc sp. TaxID=1180 RepID=UPI002FFB2911
MSRAQFLSYKDWLEKSSKQLPKYHEKKRSSKTQPSKQSKGYSCILLAVTLLIIIPLSVALIEVFLPIIIGLSILSLVLSLLGFKFSPLTRFSSEESIHLDPFNRHILSGTPLMYYRDVDNKFSKIEQENNYFINIAGLRCPASLLSRHLFLMGQSGSGKTLILSLLLNSVAQRFKEQHKVRALVHDFGNTLYPSLKNAGLNPILFNPFAVQGGARWDISKDCLSEDAARQLSAGIVNSSGNLSEAPFYNAAIRHTIAAILAYLAKERGESNWGLSDICEVASEPELLKAALEATNTGQLAKGYFLGNSEMAGSARAVLRQAVFEIRGVAEMMDKQSEVFSVREWSRNWRTTLVLSYPFDRHESMKVVSGMFMQAVAESLLSKEALEIEEQKSGNCQTYLFLDELQILPMLPSLSNLLNFSRKFGGAIVMVAQSRALLNSIYGKDVTEGMISNCQTQLYCRCFGEDAEWASKLFGSVEVESETETRSESRSINYSQTDTLSRTQLLKPNVSPDQLMLRPIISTDNSVGGFGISQYGGFVFELEASYLYEQGLSAPVESSGSLVIS